MNKKPGRRPLSPDEESVPVSIRLTVTQREKLRRLGGGEWVRKQLDKMKESK